MKAVRRRVEAMAAVAMAASTEHGIDAGGDGVRVCVQHSGTFT